MAIATKSDRVDRGQLAEHLIAIDQLGAWDEIIPIAIGGLILLPLASWVVRALAAADRAAARWGLSPGRTADWRSASAAWCCACWCSLC